MAKRIKVVITGYYDVDMDHAIADYGTVNPNEMLAVDQSNADKTPASVIEWLDEDPTVQLSWED